MKLEQHAVVDVVQRAYAQVDDDATWKSGLAKAAFRLVGCGDGFGLLQYRWQRDVAGDFRVTEVVDVRHSGEHVRWGEDAVRAHLTMPPALAEQLCGRTFASNASAVLGAGVEDPTLRSVWRVPILDVLGIVACEPDGHGLALAVGSRERFTFSSRARTMLNRVAFHLAAGFRLRLSGRSSLEDAEAILTPTGKVLQYPLHEAASFR